MPDSGEWYGYIKGFSLWNCRQIQDGKRQGKQIICCPSGPCIIRRFMSKWTWYRCSRPNQVGGWEPWSHHSLRFFCWFITWPGRSIPEETVCWLGVLKNMLEIDVPVDLQCSILYLCELTFLNAKYVDPGVANSALYNDHTACVGWTLCTVAVTRGTGILDSPLLSVALSCCSYGISSWLPCGWTCLIIIV